MANMPFGVSADEIQSNEPDEQALTASSSEIQAPDTVKEPSSKAINSRHQNAEDIIKSEMKQLIFDKISEETRSKVLNDILNAERITLSNLRSNTDQIIIKTNHLNREMEMDQSKFAQCSNVLMRIEEIISLLKENVDKLEKSVDDAEASDMLKKSFEQREKLSSIENQFIPLLKDEEEKHQSSLKILNERKALLQEEYKHWQQILAHQEQKYQEIKNINQTYCEELQNALSRKSTVEQKFISICEKADLDCKVLEDEIQQQTEQIAMNEEEIKTELDSLSNVEKIKIDLEKQLESKQIEDENENKSLLTEIARLEEANSNQLAHLKELENTLKEIKTSTSEANVKLDESYKEVHQKVEKVETSINLMIDENAKFDTTLNEQNASYIKLCKDQNKVLHQKMKDELTLLDLKANLRQKISNSEGLKEKLNQLKAQHESLIITAESLDQAIIDYEKNHHRKLAEAVDKHQHLTIKYEKSLEDMRKKKEYSLATGKYLSEKLTSLQQEESQVQIKCQNLEEENESLKSIIQSKQNEFDGLKIKFEDLRKTEPSGNSVFKSPVEKNFGRKVHFNDILSFKSATESEDSQLDNATEKPLPDWLKVIQNSFNPNNMSD